MFSEVYGIESFDYDSEEELEKGLTRLSHDVSEQEKKDGIQRWLSVRIEEDEDDDEDEDVEPDLSGNFMKAVLDGETDKETE